MCLKGDLENLVHRALGTSIKVTAKNGSILHLLRRASFKCSGGCHEKKVINEFLSLPMLINLEKGRKGKSAQHHRLLKKMERVHSIIGY